MEEPNIVSGIVWKVLFADEPVRSLDPNKEENVPAIKAMNQAVIDKLKRFTEGDGKVLFEVWQKEIRAGIFNLLVEPLNECRCEKVREMRTKIKLIASVQGIIAGK